MSRFAQQTRLIPTKGNAEKLIAKFLEAADAQRENDSCELMLISMSDGDGGEVYVIEVWSSESAWNQANQSPAVAAWAKDLPALVSAPPTTTRFAQIDGKGI